MHDPGLNWPVIFYLMTTNNVVVNTEWESLSGIESGWSNVERRRKQKVLLIFGVKASTSLIKFKITCGNLD